MDVTEVLQLLLILLIGWTVIKFLTTPKNLPPGPWGLPIIGHRIFLGSKPHVAVANLQQKYGDIIRINLGTTDAIFLTSFKAVKEALVKQSDVFSNRNERLLPPMVREVPGVISSNGELWSEFRGFTLSSMRELGFGKSSIEPQIKSEIQYFIDEVKSYNGQPASINKALRCSITNIICVIMTGKRFEYDDTIFNELLQITEEHISLLKLGAVKNMLPFALQKPWIMRLLGTKSSIETLIAFRTLLSKIVDKYEEDYKQGSVDNFINAWFTESDKLGSKVHNFNKKQLVGVLTDLFMAGSDTTTTTLRWSVLYMIKYPDVQINVKNEIDEVIGNERTPSMTDQKMMPYTEATLMEINRIASIAPLSLMHCTNKDTTLNGFFIPKNSTIVPNLWAIHHDPDIFSQPDDFNPQRFLTDDLQVKRMDELIPFSIGKRQCMGESLAKMELFLYFTSMLQHFTLKGVDGIEVDFDYDFALVSTPKQQLIRAIVR